MAAAEPTVVAEISRSDLEHLDSPLTASITDVRHLSSYNWIDEPEPTIVVPGSPSLWAPPKDPVCVNKDSGHYYIDQNAARHPSSPLEPLFRALYVTDSSFDIRSTDVVTDRNSIRKLVSFIRPRISPSRLQEFTINVDTIKNTTLFSRQEKNPVQFIEPQSFKGFGHEFESVCTTEKVVGNTGHHRIISYRFGGLNFIIRHETDAYVGAESDLPVPSGNGEQRVRKKIRSKSARRGSTLTVRQSGHVVPLECTLEIKTRAFDKPLSVYKIVPQLWISQTPKLVRGYYEDGVFQVPDVQDVTCEIQEWERNNQETLRQLAAVIRRILDVAKGCDGPVTVKHDMKKKKLVLWKVDRLPLLPQDLYSKWD
ncbi:hypothetical protein F5Y05DRAFT_255615 [Hypoxylon sp. FL0543]|nr:hypothetical protein F5Y05DRAFT_255615 [Hypoxylon sp. FL0543]